MLRWMAIGLPLILGKMAGAQTNDSAFIARLADEVLVNGKAYDNLRVLCKQVGGRLAGSPQIYKAEKWGTEALKAAGADKVYLQECQVPRWVRGGKDSALVMYTGSTEKPVWIKMPLDVLALGNSLGTGTKGVEAPVILIHNFDELEKRKDEIKGKIVFYNYPFNEKYVQPFRAYAEAGVYRWNGPSRAAKYGAVAVVIRSLSASSDNYPHTGSMGYDSAYPKIPCAAMGLRDADKLAALLGAGKKIKLYYHSNAHFLPDTIGHNVIGEYTGSESPNEYMTVGGHLDSWDPAEGAHDDGTGCVHAIEILRAMKAVGYRPKHTLRVVLFVDRKS
ncbi:MAG TPA: M28 family peptidase, partial [Chitinophagaceae bacterium]|nr:M28 family peptidase [Chitinophagaceae bacterium]